MSQGKWQLRAAGITPQAADKVHSAAIKAQAFTDRMSSDAMNHRYEYMDDTGAMQHYRYEERDSTGRVLAVHNVTNEEEMGLALAQQRERSGKLASRDKKLDAEMHRTGQARGYRDSVRRPNDKSTSAFNQAVTDRYLSSRQRKPYSKETGPDDYMYGGSNATGYDFTDHI